MEKLGIGTKATRANILQTLYDRNYVTDSQITVTQFGSKIIEVLKKRVPELTSEALTHDFEENVEKIRDGSLDKDTVLENAQKMLLKIMDKFKPHIQEIGEALSESYQIARKTQNTLGKCLQCEKGNLIIRRARASGKQFVGFSAYPDCHCSFPLPQFAKIEKTDKPCEHDGLPVIKVIRAGKRPFTMCIDPKCPSKADWGKKKPASDNKDQASDEAKKVDESETPKKSATKKKKA
jgi:DNA topoisomerase-1